MSFDAPFRPKRRIAIVGAGISGLASAYLLAPDHDVTVFEAENRLGGHARTIMAGQRGNVAVDTGFIVFNYPNYPNLTAMFDALDVPVKKSDMSFGASIDGGRIEYGLQTLNQVFGQRRNMVRPEFLGMVRDILRFNKGAIDALRDDNQTIGDLIDEMGLGDWFMRYYLMPLCGAIWSTPPAGVRAYPAASLVHFFKNHALLSTTGQHQWWTVDGGSIEYVTLLERHLRRLGVTFHMGAKVRAVTRTANGVTIRAKGGVAMHFDEVIMASHSDQSLAMLTDATPQEQSALGDLTYQPNRVLLHADTSQMPKRRSCWSSWIYKADNAGAETKLGVTYWMNRLQGLPENDPLFISLNPASSVREELIYDEVSFDHPLFDTAAMAAQKRLAALQGTNRTWFAGAYMRNGFHEDGFHSAAEVARQIADTSVAMAAQ
ncbi:NAD(P)/FAD-dependent oxidoreductase [Celeribacter arenosi]|uniref:FAD-dependent oxidoreductase n=1 Tax=Celeribacter arenosi TaxID=792649 RepID=A0ABP7JS42_9RHOB